METVKGNETCLIVRFTPRLFPESDLGSGLFNNQTYTVITCPDAHPDPSLRTGHEMIQLEPVLQSSNNVSRNRTVENLANNCKFASNHVLIENMKYLQTGEEANNLHSTWKGISVNI